MDFKLVKIFTVLFIFSLTLFALHSSTSYAQSCPAPGSGFICGTNPGCPGCTCDCNDNQCGIGSGWDTQCPGSFCCGGGCSDSNPANVSLFSPGNGALVKGLSINLDWSDTSSWGTACSNQNNRYRVYIERQSSYVTHYGNVQNYIGETTNSSFTHTVGTLNTIYYWQIEVTNNARSVRSPIWTFTTNGPPTGVVGVTGNINSFCVGSTYSIYTNASDPNSNIYSNNLYRRRINPGVTGNNGSSDYAAGSGFILMSQRNCTTGSTCNISPVGWTPGSADVGSWRFLMTTWDQLVNWTVDSDPWNYSTRCSGNIANYWSRCGATDYTNVTVSQPVSPAAPVLLAPTNGATGVALQPTLSWSHTGNFGATCGATQSNSFRVDYRVVGASPWSAVFASSTARSAIVPSALAQNTQYQWRVCATNGQSSTCSHTANFWVFTTCSNTPPAQANLIGESLSGTTATLSWNAVTNLGTRCGVITPSYSVIVGTTNPPTPVVGTVPYAYNTNPLSYPFAGTRGTTYYWRIATTNGGAVSYSAVRSFTLSSMVEGWIWNVDSVGGSCSNLGSVNDTSGEIRLSDTGGDPIEVYVSGGTPAGTWDLSKNGKSYDIDGVSSGNQVICADIEAGSPNFQWQLECNGTTDVGGLGSGCVSVNVDTGVKRLDLGYTLGSNGWYTGFDGDIYADGISLGVPRDAQVSGGFSPYLGNYLASVFASDGVSVINSDPTPLSRIADSDVYAEYVGTSVSNTWLENFSFTAPDGAVDLGCNNGLFTAATIRADTVYKISSSCLNNALENLGNNRYTLNGSTQGVALVYVYFDGDNQIVFGAGNQALRATSLNRKIMFIVGDQIDIVISRELGETSDSSFTDASISNGSLRPHLEAALIAEGNILFEANPTPADPNTPRVPDLSVLVDGPLVSKSSISFNRNKGINNGYPAQVVKYDSKYLEDLSNQESAGISGGVSLINISWQLEE